jgi:hypothetical protein
MVLPVTAKLCPLRAFNLCMVALLRDWASGPERRVAGDEGRRGVGKRPGDDRDIGQVFDEWSLATDPPLSADLLLGDRDEQATDVLRWLNKPPWVLSMQAEATSEAIAFLRAVIDPLPISHRFFWESRLIVARSDDAAGNLLGLFAPRDWTEPSPDARLVIGPFPFENEMNSRTRQRMLSLLHFPIGR